MSVRLLRPLTRIDRASAPAVCILFSLCPSVTLPNSSGLKLSSQVKCDHLASATCTSTNNSTREVPVSARSSPLCPTCLIIIATHSHTIYIARLLLPDLLELHFAQSTVCVWWQERGFVCLQRAAASTFTFCILSHTTLLHLCMLSSCSPALSLSQYYEQK